MKIGRLEPVPLRDVWPKEEGDFSKWLAENLDTLSEAIRVNLELVETEKKVAGTNLEIDIFCLDDDGEKVVVENQLEKTDHSHLGQILTYAVNIDAPTVIWITRETRQEHINVINWLNEVSDKGFYLVKVEAYRIDDSSVAPFFSIICRPTQDVKKLGAEKKEIEIDRLDRRQRRADADTIIVPARKEGFDEVFIGEQAWWSIRIKESKIADLKYIAGYQVHPISAITHLAKIKSIVVSPEDPSKYKINFDGPAKEIKSIPLGKISKIQGPSYCLSSDLSKVRNIDELFAASKDELNPSAQKAS